MTKHSSCITKQVARIPKQVRTYPHWAKSIEGAVDPQTIAQLFTNNLSDCLNGDYDHKELLRHLYLFDQLLLEEDVGCCIMEQLKRCPELEQKLMELPANHGVQDV